MLKILNELVKISIYDRFILADKTARGGHNQAYKHLRANTTLGQLFFGIELSLIGIHLSVRPHNTFYSYVRW